MTTEKKAARPAINLWQRRFQKLGILGILLLTINFGFQVWFRYFPQPTSYQAQSHRQCDLQKKPCTARMAGDRRVTLTVSPRGIPIDKELCFSVELNHIEADEVFIALTSKGRAQSFKRIPLKNNAVNRFEGNFQLSHIAPEKQWIALVQVITAQENITIPFRFQAKS